MSMRGLPMGVRVLLITQMLFNVGFYLVVPFIPVHMAGEMGASGAAVGLVLGLRTFSQQGLFFLGGGLSDRYGARPILIIGVTIRIVGFIGAGLAPNVAWMLAGVVLIGFAAALFSPAVESTLAVEGLALERAGVTLRSRVFALDAAWSRIGVLAGPILGALLIPIGFTAACIGGAAVFTVILVGHLLLLSRSSIGHGTIRADMEAAAGDGAGAGKGDRDVVKPTSMIAAWGGVLRNRTFVVFALLYSTYLVGYNQMYLALPVELRRATGSDGLLGWFFALASVWVILLQGPVHDRAVQWGRPAALTAGFGLMSLAFLIVAVAAPFPVDGVAALVPAVVFVLILQLGEIIAAPIARDLVGDIGGNRDLGSYYGFLNSFGGLAVLIASTTLGGMLDAAESPGPAAIAPWAVMAVVMAIAAVGLRLLAIRYGRHTTAAESQTSASTAG